MKPRTKGTRLGIAAVVAAIAVTVLLLDSPAFADDGLVDGAADVTSLATDAVEDVTTQTTQVVEDVASQATDAVEDVTTQTTQVVEDVATQTTVAVEDAGTVVTENVGQVAGDAPRPAAPGADPRASTVSEASDPPGAGSETADMDATPARRETAGNQASGAGTGSVAGSSLVVSLRQREALPSRALGAASGEPVDPCDRDPQLVCLGLLYGLGEFADASSEFLGMALTGLAALPLLLLAFGLAVVGSGALAAGRRRPAVAE